MSCWSAPARAAWWCAGPPKLMRERIGRLVFVDALALLDGEKIARHRSPLDARCRAALTAGPSREDAENRLFADLDPKTRAWALERYTPHPIGFR